MHQRVYYSGLTLSYHLLSTTSSNMKHPALALNPHSGEGPWLVLISSAKMLVNGMCTFNDKLFIADISSSALQKLKGGGHKCSFSFIDFVSTCYQAYDACSFKFYSTFCKASKLKEECFNWQSSFATKSTHLNSNNYENSSTNSTCSFLDIPNENGDLEFNAERHNIIM